MIMINKTPKLSCGQGPGVIFPLAEENKPDSRVNWINKWKYSTQKNKPNKPTEEKKEVTQVIRAVLILRVPSCMGTQRIMVPPLIEMEEER